MQDKTYIRSQAFARQRREHFVQSAAQHKGNGPIPARVRPGTRSMLITDRVNLLSQLVAHATGDLAAPRRIDGQCAELV